MPPAMCGELRAALRQCWRLKGGARHGPHETPGGELLKKEKWGKCAKGEPERASKNRASPGSSPVRMSERWQGELSRSSW
jgi:hypothetical protein